MNLASHKSARAYSWQIPLLFLLLLISGGSAAAQCVAPPQGLVSWWPGGGHARDIRDGNDGTLESGAFYGPGIVGTSFGFDGVDDYVLVPESPNLDFAPGSSITIELWALRKTNAWTHLVGKRAGCGSDHDFYQVAISPDAIPPDSVPLNVWTHLAVVWDADKGTETAYVNGTVVYEANALNGSNDAPLEIGNSGACNPFAGSIDEVSIYNRALHASEIQAIANAGSYGKCKELHIAVPTSATEPIPAYRFFCDWGDHFYTSSTRERDAVEQNLPCTYEGVAWYAYANEEPGTSPVYRLWCPWWDHFYTASEAEKNYAISYPACTYERVAWYAYLQPQPGALPVYRLLCPWGDHFYTMDAQEKKSAMDLFLCTDEGVAWYALENGLAYQLHGLDFSPYIADDEDPNLGDFQISQEELRTRLEMIQPYTRWVRTFGCNTDLKDVGALAHAMGLKAAIGAWLGRDQTENEKQINCLIETAQQGHADMAIVGSEVLRRGDLSSGQLVDYLRRVKAAVPGVPVTYADIYGEILAHPDVLSAVDRVLINDYGYWEGVEVTTAVPALHRVYQQVVAAAHGKPVIISETGWPSCGEAVGEAVPSLENANYYFLNFVSWARANAARYFYFEAFDEPWKAGAEGSQGACWGLWDKHGNLKPGMRQVFDGAVMPDNWSGNGSGSNNGTGDPAIEFTSVPSRGSFGNLFGRVLNVSPAEYNVAVFIYVGSGWWTKPYWEEPLTAIGSDGTWATDITTGGNDEQATRIAAFLVPAGYNPPLASGDSTLPAELEQWAVAKIEVTR